MNKTAKIIIWTFMLLSVVVLLGFVEKSRNAQFCTSIYIDIDRKSQNFFIDEEDVEAIIHEETNAIVNTPLIDLNSNQMEYQLNNHPAIKNAEVYKNLDGILSIKVAQREPIVRVFSSNGDSFYIDKDGQLMPLSSKYTARVLIANGFIFSPYKTFVGMDFNKGINDSIAKKTLIDDVYKYAQFINDHPFWKSQIEQLHVNKEMDIELIPRVGNHRIVFGDATDIENKFEKLIVFYNKGLSKTGWNEYSVINLKYADQVVCTKR